jgi:hypothetical protein
MEEEGRRRELPDVMNVLGEWAGHVAHMEEIRNR